MDSAVAAWAGVAVAALTLAWAVTLVLLRHALNRTAEDAVRQIEIAHMGAKLGELVADQDQMRAAMLEQMTADRAATDRRLRWLEEFVWKTSPRGRSPISRP